jgi:hypothetical protein
MHACGEEGAFVMIFSHLPLNAHPRGKDELYAMNFERNWTLHAVEEGILQYFLPFSVHSLISSTPHVTCHISVIFVIFKKC